METTVTTKKTTIQSVMGSQIVMKKLNDCLGNPKAAASFASSVVSLTTGNYMLKDADPWSVVGAAMVAATLGLSIVPSIGEAYIIPYKLHGQTKAQFQLGWKGLYQLCIRSGQFAYVCAEPVHKGELVSGNRFTGDYQFDETKKESDEVIGYMASFRLTNGFAKTVYWTIDEVKKHATRFSQSYRRGGDTPWKSDFDAMACKTVLNSLLSKYGPKSLDFVDALRYDQSAVKIEKDNISGDDIIMEPEYIDNSQSEAMDNITKAAEEATE